MVFLNATAGSSLPTLMPDLIYSFYPYPVLARTKVHASLLQTSATPSSTDKKTANDQSDSGLSTQQLAKSRNAKERAARRALMGRRPAGVALGREAEELSDEEAALDDEKVCSPLPAAPI